MKVAFFGYRDWAIRIHQNLVMAQNDLWQIVESDDASVMLFYGWSWKIPKEVYTNHLCLILHPSPLPKYRGGSPIQHQIINGEKMSAVTILTAGEKLDAGDILSQTPFSLEGSLDDIFNRITAIGFKDTVKILNDLATYGAKFRPQKGKATVFKRRKPEESEIKNIQSKTAEELHNFIRALNDPYPNAYLTCKDGKKLYITGSHL